MREYERDEEEKRAEQEKCRKNDEWDEEEDFDEENENFDEAHSLEPPAKGSPVVYLLLTIIIISVAAYFLWPLRDM